MASVIDAVERGIQHNRAELAIAGMTCASCVGHVTRALKKVPGVLDAQVNLASEHATIEFNAPSTQDDLIAAIVAAGYGATPVQAGAAAEDADAERREHEIARKRNLLILAIALCVPTVALAMFVPDFAYKNWLLLALTLPVWGGVGWTFHRGAIAMARHGTANMDTLVSLGSTAALGYSIYATIARQPVYYDTASAIITLIFLGKYLETVAKGKSNNAIRALLGLRPNTARVRDAQGRVREISVDDVRTGDELIVPAGERIAVDGVVAEGRSAIDVSMLTGEPLPQEVEPGDSVKAGTLNGDGTLVVRATAVGAGTVLARIVEIVRAAQGSTPPVQRLADRVAGVFVPVILGVAAITFAGWMLTGHSWVHALVAAVAVLVVACPCALGLATPMSIMVGVGVGARRGVLFKDADALEHIGTAHAVVFDKTGTLTVGRPHVLTIAPLLGRDEADVLAVAAAVERGSSHPLASVIVRAADEGGVAHLQATNARTERGQGVAAEIDGGAAIVGTREYLESNGIVNFDGLGAPKFSEATIVYVALAGVLLGRIEIADEVRVSSAAAIASLRELGVEAYVVSGDAAGPVRALAERVGIDPAHTRSSVTPEGKAAFVQALRAQDKHVAFVGDGINDAPALASADVGLAMGGGTEIAMETADAAILSNDPRAVAGAVALSRATMKTIRANLFWAFGYNVVLVPLAAFGIVQPIYAAAAMGVSSLFVVGNSLLLRRR